MRRRGSSRVDGNRPTSMWRPTIRAHLLRCLGRDGLRRTRRTPRPSTPSAPRIWTLLVGLVRPSVVPVFLRVRVPASQGLAGGPVICASLLSVVIFSALFLVGFGTPAFAQQGDANAGKALYELKCA